MGPKLRLRVSCEGRWSLRQSTGATICFTSSPFRSNSNLRTSAFASIGGHELIRLNKKHGASIYFDSVNLTRANAMAGQCGLGLLELRQRLRSAVRAGWPSRPCLISILFLSNSSLISD